LHYKRDVKHYYISRRREHSGKDWLADRVAASSPYRKADDNTFLTVSGQFREESAAVAIVAKCHADTASIAIDDEKVDAFLVLVLETNNVAASFLCDALAIADYRSPRNATRSRNGNRP